MSAARRLLDSGSTAVDCGENSTHEEDSSDTEDPVDDEQEERSPLASLVWRSATRLEQHAHRSVRHTAIVRADQVDQQNPQPTRRNAGVTTAGANLQNRQGSFAVFFLSLHVRLVLSYTRGQNYGIQSRLQYIILNH